MRKTILTMAIVAVAAIAFGAVLNAAAKPEFGIVKVGDANSAVELQMDKTTKVIVTAKGVNFPVGSYTPVAMTVMRLDKAGKQWSVGAKIAPFTVTAGQITTIPVPTKVTVKAVFYQEQMTPAGRVLPVGVVFTSAETEVASEFKMGGTSVLAPVFQIVDSRGRELQLGSFTYG